MYIIVYPSFKIVNGPTRCLLVDLQKSTYTILPKELGYFIKQTKQKSIATIKSCLSLEEQLIVDEYIEYLLGSSIAFIGDYNERICFREMPTKYDSPYDLTNLVIDLSEPFQSDIEALLKRLGEVYIQTVLLVSCTKTSIELLRKVVEVVSSTEVEEIRVALAENDNSIVDDLRKVCYSYVKIFEIVLYNSSTTEVITLEDNMTRIIFSEKRISNCFSCGVISKENFTVNSDFYNESLQYNNCLNKKLAISNQGRIKNCLAFDKDYGSINECDFRTLISDESFTALWGVRKSQISKCKVCEFRLICQDCRAMIENPYNPFSPPLKCNYDPYSATWR